MSEQDMNAVLIGAGRMGQAHAKALKLAGITLRGVCDQRREALDSMGDDYGVPADSRYLSAEALFADWRNVDIVVIATTADTHCFFVCAAASAGAKMILCEKPMAVSVDECRRMVAACEASGSRLAINHQMRFMDQYRLVKEVIDSGALGRLACMSVVAGCFGLSMNGSHYVEAFNYLTGAWPEKVTGWFSGEPLPNPRGAQFADQAGAFYMVAPGGQRLSLAIGHDHGHGMTVTYAGEYGHIFVDELAAEALITTRQPEFRDMPSTRYGMPWDRRTESFPQADNVGPTLAVLEALIAGANYPDGQHGLEVVRAVAACYKSAETGLRDVAVQTGLDEGRRFPWA